MDTKTSDERLAAICQKIRNETVEPALQEAEQIKQLAEREAAKIRMQAKQDAEKILREARQELAQERHMFTASLHQASQQAISLLKEKIESSLFSPSLESYLATEFQQTEQMGAITNLIITHLTNEGLQANDLEITIGSKLNKDSFVKYLLASAIHHIPKEGIVVGSSQYGFSIKVASKHLRIEVTPSAIREMISTFIRHDFRRFLFQEP